MKILRTVLVLSLSLTAAAQTTAGKLSFALPEHPGSLSLDQGNFKITELSAKPAGNEFGIRAENGDLKFLGFLFLGPEKPHFTSESCRDEVLKSEGRHTLAEDQGRSSYMTANGVRVATVLLIPESGKFSALRVFVAHEDLCADLLFTYMQPVTKKMFPMEQSKVIVNSINFVPDAKPTFRDAFAYATVEWDHHDVKGAAAAYSSALKLVEQSDDPLKWRRVTTDQLSMSLGMSGDIPHSREVNEAAIARDPGYPLYYFNLACADAESGDAAGARKHLQQAFDRRANMLKGEPFPDPAADDSIQKLKSDKNFWSFVEGLSKQLNKT